MLGITRGGTKKKRLDLCGPPAQLAHSQRTGHLASGRMLRDHGRYWKGVRLSVPCSLGVQGVLRHPALCCLELSGHPPSLLMHTSCSPEHRRMFEASCAIYWDVAQGMRGGTQCKGVLQHNKMFWLEQNMREDDTGGIFIVMDVMQRTNRELLFVTFYKTRHRRPPRNLTGGKLKENLMKHFLIITLQCYRPC